MSLLLDTHALLWYALDDTRLSKPARDAIENETGIVYVSAASYWELAIKISIRRYALSVPFDQFWEKAIFGEGLTLLPVEIRHANRLIALPYVHRDPFDRMLVVQALVEKLSLVSNDPLLDAYNIHRIW